MGKGTFDLLELILYLSEDVLSKLLCSHILNINDNLGVKDASCCLLGENLISV